MSTRDFRDSHNVLWHVYEVRPLTPITRAGPPRDTSNSSGSMSRPEVHDVTDERAWLVFESGDEKRRLVPVPQDWDRVTDTELELLCSRAAPARPRRPF